MPYIHISPHSYVLSYIYISIYLFIHIYITPLPAYIQPTNQRILNFSFLFRIPFHFIKTSHRIAFSKNRSPRLSPANQIPKIKNQKSEEERHGRRFLIAPLPPWEERKSQQ